MFSHTLNLLNNNTHIIEIISIVIVVSIILCIFIYVAIKQTAKSGNCVKISEANPVPNTLSPLSSQTLTSQQFNNYYIQTAYNCCCSGDFKDDWVNTCALSNAISQGCRCLDFEIYSMNNKPIVACSSVNNFYIKESYNYIPFSQVATIINEEAFNSDYCTNYTDPLILHFRFKTNNTIIYNQMATIFSTKITNATFLEDKYNCDGSGNVTANILTEKLDSSSCGSGGIFNNTIIVFVDGSNTTWASTNLKEYVNVSSQGCTNGSNSIEYREFDIGICGSPCEPEEKVKNGYEVFVWPNLQAKAENPPYTLAYSYGCQIVGMCFQVADGYLKDYINFFSGKGSAFVLKEDVSISVTPDASGIDVGKSLVGKSTPMVTPFGTYQTYSSS